MLSCGKNPVSVVLREFKCTENILLHVHGNGTLHFECRLSLSCQRMPPGARENQAYLKRVDQLCATHPPLSQVIQPLQHTFQPLASLVDRRPGNLELSLRQEIPANLPKRHAELLVLGLGRIVPAVAAERLAKDRVAHGKPARDLGVHGLERLVLDGQEGAVGARLGVAHGQGAEPGRLLGGRAVPREREAVAGLGLDLPRQLLDGRVVVEHGVRAQGPEVVKVARRGGGEDGEPGELGELDAQDPGRGAPPVDEDGLGRGQRAVWLGQLQELVETLPDGRDADTEGGGLLEADIVRDLQLYVSDFEDVVSEGTPFTIIPIAMNVRGLLEYVYANCLVDCRFRSYAGVPLRNDVMTK